MPRPIHGWSPPRPLATPRSNHPVIMARHVVEDTGEQHHGDMHHDEGHEAERHDEMHRSRGLPASEERQER